MSWAACPPLPHYERRNLCPRSPPLCVPECEAPELPPTLEPDPAHPWNQPSAAATASATKTTLPFFMRPLPLKLQARELGTHESGQTNRTARVSRGTLVAADPVRLSIPPG